MTLPRCSRGRLRLPAEEPGRGLRAGQRIDADAGVDVRLTPALPPSPSNSLRPFVAAAISESIPPAE